LIQIKEKFAIADILIGVDTRKLPLFIWRIDEEGPNYDER